MAKDVEDYVKSCERCIKTKSPSQVAPMTPIQATHPLQFVTMDYLTVEKAIGYENILVIIDHFTKFAQAYPTKNQRQLQQPRLCLTLFEDMASQRNFIPIKDKHLWVKS